MIKNGLFIEKCPRSLQARIKKVVKLVDDNSNINFGYNAKKNILKRNNNLYAQLLKLPDGEGIFYMSNPALGLWAFN
ncbi:MAG: hypothetical protein OQJ78_01885 [Ignavibacteriaceae bacterium]|jgi:hypothetical protein|nr:hypothetical protein [Ignavibacteriaceae bacterium]